MSVTRAEAQLPHIHDEIWSVATTQIRDEARDRGQLGPTAIRMLVRVFEGELPSFRGLASMETAEDFAYEFFVDRNQSYVDAVRAAPDDNAAERITRKWARHWLVDRARETPYGKLRDRIDKRLQNSPLFRRSSVRHHWCLTDGEDVDRPVTFDDLYAAAMDVRVEMFVEENGRVLLGRAGQLEQMMQRLLELGGRLHISDLTRLCAHRFPSVLEVGDWLTAQQPTTEMQVAEDTQEAADWIVATAEQRADARDARQIFDQLSATDRVALRYADDPSELGAHLQVGRSTAYSRIKHAKAKLLELAGDRARSKLVMTDVLALILDEDRAVPSYEGEGA